MPIAVRCSAELGDAPRYQCSISGGSSRYILYSAFYSIRTTHGDGFQLLHRLLQCRLIPTKGAKFDNSVLHGNLYAIGDLIGDNWHHGASIGVQPRAWRPAAQASWHR